MLVAVKKVAGLFDAGIDVILAAMLMMTMDSMHDVDDTDSTGF